MRHPFGTPGTSRIVIIGLLGLSLAGCAGEQGTRFDLGGGAADLGSPGQEGPLTEAGPKSDRAVMDSKAPPPDKTVPADLALVPDAKPAVNLLQNITLAVNLGDSLAAGASASAGHSYRALLYKNDDVKYPSYKGKDLITLFPTVKVVDKSKSGAVTQDVVAQAKSVGGNPSGNTVVLISAGGNDFNNSVATMTIPANTLAAATKAAANLKQVYAHFANKALFPGKVIIAQIKVYDPTDGKGSIPNLSGLSGLCKTIQGAIGVLFGSIAVANLGTFNKTLEAAAKTAGVVVVDNHDAFLGHGFNYQDKTWKNYQAADPTLWFANDCAHANDRGHHELRRLFWTALTGQ